MLPGPIEYYKCPKCQSLTSRGSLLSGNTFGAKLYSDGKQIAPMLPEFPAIIKCKKCGTFFWLKDENEIKIEDETIESYSAEFLSVNEYNEAINSEIFTNNKELHFLRIRLWWAFNDRIRQNNDIFLSENDQQIYEKNCLKLLEILDKNDINEKIMCAEIYRNLGSFNECQKIIETLEDKFSWIKELLNIECNNNNKNVIVIRQ